MPRTNERAVTPQSEDFSAWYNEVVVRAELADRGPVRGTVIMRPYGYRIWELIQAELDGRIKATGHENAYFPIFIPEGHLRREAEHVEGFSPELAVVTHAGGRELDEPLVVRPTSETIIGEAFSRWIESYRDLPLLINQWANVVRWELRPRMFLRSTEFLWQEGHTAHEDDESAAEETMTALGFYEDLCRHVAAMPVIVGEKTPRERFAGAQRTYALEAMMRDGRALQAATSHDLGTNFARAFDITYATRDGGLEYCRTTSWGMSFRMIGGVIMAHGDDKGLVLPPKLAPFQVVVVPIAPEAQRERVFETARSFAGELTKAGIRTRLDDRTQLSPGFKFNEWEMRGVPLRVEIGPRDLDAGVVTLVERLTSTKSAVPLGSAAGTLTDQLASFQQALYERAEAFMNERITKVDTFDELVAAVETGFALALHCGEESCELAVKEATTATPRCIPFDGEQESGPCAICGKDSVYEKRVVFARAY